jgi:tight adherence protein C
VQLWFAVLFLVAASMLLGVLALQSLRAREVAMTRLLRRGTQLAVAMADAPSLSLRAQLVRWVAPLSGQLGAGTYGPLRVRLAEAGYRGPSALSVYMGSRFALALALPAAVLPGLILLAPAGVWLLGTASAAAAGFVLPGAFVDMRRKRRQQALFERLPDAIDLMVVCVESGLGLGAALHRVAAELRAAAPVLAGELELAVLETQAGKSLSAALHALADRCGVPDLSTLISALVQTERLGTRIADTLRVQADSMREKRLRLAEEIAQKAPVKMLFPAAFIFSAMLIVTIVPAVLGMVKAFSDQ